MDIVAYLVSWATASVVLSGVALVWRGKSVGVTFAVLTALDAMIAAVGRISGSREASRCAMPGIGGIAAVLGHACAAPALPRSLDSFAVFPLWHTKGVAMSPSRPPCVAGAFYPAEPDALKRAVSRHLAAPAASPPPAVPVRPLVTMLPHAGYVYCGDVIGATLAEIELPSRLVVLCPNHTGRGAPLAVWPDGQWLTPVGAVPVDTELTGELCALAASFGDAPPRPVGFAPDTAAHAGEHSLEVLLPFLLARVPGVRIAPVCVGTGDGATLHMAGLGLAALLEAHAAKGEDVALVVSSDMNHYATHERTLELDEHALAPLLRLDPDGLARTVFAERISMCGVCPMVMALIAACKRGAAHTRLTRHTTSAAASGDTSRVVGYAGVYVW